MHAVYKYCKLNENLIIFLILLSTVSFTLKSYLHSALNIILETYTSILNILINYVKLFSLFLIIKYTELLNGSLIALFMTIATYKKTTRREASCQQEVEDRLLRNLLFSIKLINNQKN